MCNAQLRLIICFVLVSLNQGKHLEKVRSSRSWPHTHNIFRDLFEFKVCNRLSVPSMSLQVHLLEYLNLIILT